MDDRDCTRRVPTPGFARLVLWAGIALTTGSAPTPHAHAQSITTPIVEFVSDRVLVFEDDGIATVEVMLTGPVLTTTTVSALTADGEGTADLDDYVGTGTFAQWNRNTSGIRTVSFEVRPDVVVEPDETVYFDLLPANDGLYVLGTRTRCEVVIVDDDSGVRPFFELSAPLLADVNGTGYFLAESGETAQLTVRLTEPAPAGFEAQYTIDGGPVQALPFATGSSTASLAVPPPAGPIAGGVHGERRVELVNAALARANGGLVTGATGGWLFANTTQQAQCLVCMLMVALHGISGTVGCPEACQTEPSFEPYACPPARRATDLSDLVPTLRDYRDQILATTPAGQYYVQLYRQYSWAIVRAAFRDSAVLGALLDAGREWSPAFAGLVSGSGASALVTGSMQSSLTRLLDALGAAGDPALADVVSFERDRLGLDTLVDRTMDQVQTQLETLGGGVSSADESFGAVKAFFGARDGRN